MNSYIPFFCFDQNLQKLTRNTKSKICDAAQISIDNDQQPWSDIKSIVDKLHKFACGHSNYSDIRTFLDRNQLWIS